LAYGQKRRAWEGEIAVLTQKSDSSNFAVLTFLLALAIIGFIMVPVLVLQTNLGGFQVYAQNYIVGTAYIAICLLGIAAVFYPAKCKSTMQKSQNPLFPEKSAVPIQIKGHHPACNNYSANRITVGGRAICAACGGLLIGGNVALVWAALFFFFGLNMGGGSVWLLVLGEVLMFLGLAQIKFAGYAKVFVNLFFVVGSFLVLAETNMLGGNVLVDVYALGLVGYALWLRILLSEHNNRRICLKCQSCFQ
jgi:hypothetical protein